MCPGYWSFYRVLPSFSWPIPSSISSGTWVLGRLLGFTEFLIEVGRFFPLPFRNGSDSVSSAQRLPRSFVCFFVFFCFTEFLIEAGWLLIRIKEQFYGRDSSFIESWLELDRFHRWFRLELDLGSFTGFYRVFFILMLLGFTEFFFLWMKTVFRSGLEFHGILIGTWSISSLISFWTWFWVVYWVLPSFFLFWCYWVLPSF